MAKVSKNAKVAQRAANAGSGKDFVKVVKSIKDPPPFLLRYARAGIGHLDHRLRPDLVLLVRREDSNPNGANKPDHMRVVDDLVRFWDCAHRLQGCVHVHGPR